MSHSIRSLWPRHALAVAASLALTLTGLAARPVGAQGGPPAGPPPAGAPRLNQAQRARLEQRLQDRINQVVRERLALTDDQFQHLRETASRIEDARRDLRNDEQVTRFAMRQELLAGDKANETRVAELLDRLPKLERRRLDLMEQEQRELSKFLTATQRARYIGLQDELRRSMQDLQRRRLDADSTRPPGGGLGARRLKRPPPGLRP